jgi:cyanophycin synthetase
VSFFPSPALTPGRLNLMRVGRGRLLVDYAHNAAAVAGLMDFVTALDAGRRVGVIAAPGDRRDEDIRTLGKLAAALDHVIIKEDVDRRGRDEGEVAALIREGLESGGLAPDAIEVLADEMQAVDRAVELLDERDIGVVLADDVPGVLEHLRGRAQPAAIP